MSGDLDDVIAELLILWPALPDALPRDAGTQTGERVATTTTVHSVPLNVDVAAVLVDLRRAIPQWTAWAAEAAGQGATAHSGIPRNLQRLPALHDALSGLGQTRDAQRLTDTVHTWNTACRRALGLNRPDRPIGEPCPNHDDPLTVLVQPGDHGHLRYTRLDHGRPVDATIEWSSVEVLLCRHCDAVWSPSRYFWLGRLIRDANHRRTQQADDAA